MRHLQILTSRAGDYTMPSKPAQQCQRCRLLLIPHDSLVDLGSAKANLLTTKPAVQQPHGRQTLHPPRLTSPEGTTTLSNHFQGSPGDSYVVLTDSVMAESPAYSNGYVKGSRDQITRINNGNGGGNKDGQIQRNRLQTMESLFDTLSANSDIDYPICSDCADLLKDALKKKYQEACQERDLYIRFLNKLKTQPSADSEEVKQMMKEIKEMEQEYETSLGELKNLEKELQGAEKELENLQTESGQLSKQEQEFFAKQNKLTLQLMDYANERDRVNSEYQNKNEQLQKLKKVNVYNDAFCIGHDGYFGTINGLRLGRLKDKRVEWSEINAAWGQTLLLMATVIKKLNFKLIGYRLRPLGCVSKIEKIEVDPKTGQATKPITLELYSSGDYSIERILNHKRLDSAMVAFLTILKQVGEHVESLDPSLKLPYVIDKDKIGGCCIKLSMNTSNESWTTACKYVLTNAKWILAYASTR